MIEEPEARSRSSWQHWSWSRLVVTQLPEWPYPTRSADALPASINRAIPSGDPLAITYPYADGPPAALPLLWQAQDGFRFRITGGYGYHPTAKGTGTRQPNPVDPGGFVTFLTLHQDGCPCESGPLSHEIRMERETISRNHVRVVIVDKSAIGSGIVIRLFEKAFGPPKVKSDGFYLWVIRPVTEDR